MNTYYLVCDDTKEEQIVATEDLHEWLLDNGFCPDDEGYHCNIEDWGVIG